MNELFVNLFVINHFPQTFAKDSFIKKKKLGVKWKLLKSSMFKIK